MKITVVGSINTDIVAMTDYYPARGDTKFGKHIEIFSGGKGANQATACAKLGKNVTLIGSVGVDVFGDNLLRDLRENGIYTGYIKRTDQEATGMALVMIDKTAENTMLVMKGANDYLRVQDIDHALKDLKTSQVHLVQMEVSEEVVIHAMRRAKQLGVPVILDPSPAEGITFRALEYADVLIPNKQETKFLTGIEVEDVHYALQAAKSLESIGVKQTIIKMAEKECLVYTPERWEQIEPIQVEPVDTVGAGDSFAGALACAIADGEDLFSAARFASIVGALKVTRLGAQKGIPTLAEVNAFAKERKLNHYLLQAERKLEGM